MKKKNRMKRMQWHPGFVAAMNLELVAQRNEMIMEREHNLNLKPLEIDLLVIKKNRETKISNEIGHFFREHNIVEYKSPSEGLNIDVIYKVIAYAALYKSYGETVDGIMADDVTITVICWAKPQKLFRYFNSHGIDYKNQYQGIYYVEHGFLFPMQIIVSKELAEKEHVWLRALSREMRSDEEITRLALEMEKLKGKAEWEYAESVLQLAIKANKKTLNKVKEGDSMSCEALMELMAEEVKDPWGTGFRRGVKRSIFAMARTLKEREYDHDEAISLLMQAYDLDRETAEKFFS